MEIHSPRIEAVTLERLGKSLLASGRVKEGDELLKAVRAAAEGLFIKGLDAVATIQGDKNASQKELQAANLYLMEHDTYNDTGVSNYTI